MPQPFTIDELAALARVRVEDIEEYRSRGLIDPDNDGVLDELDVLRLRILIHYLRIGYTLDDLEKAIRDGSPAVLYSDLLFDTDGSSLQPEQAAEESGLSVDEVNAFRRAIGLSGPVPRDDLKFFSAVRGLLDAGVELKVLTDVARVYGDTLRRLAQTEVRLIRSFIGESGHSSVLKDRAQSERLEAVQEVVGPVLEPLLLNIHRQHLLRASVMESVAALESEEKGSDRDVIEATIVFVDLASFTPLAQVHGDEAAADVLDRFDSLVRETLEGRSGTFVKQIGDEVMLTFTHPVDGVRFVADLDAAARREPNFPALRAGLHAGPVLYRVGDYVGHTVNLASRIAAVANAHETLMTEPVAARAIEEGIAVSAVGARTLAGVDEPVELWRLERDDGDASVRDPVCGMAVGDDAAAHLVYGGLDYSFCSPECLRRFIEDPGRYVRGLTPTEER